VCVCCVLYDQSVLSDFHIVTNTMKILSRLVGHLVQFAIQRSSKQNQNYSKISSACPRSSDLFYIVNYYIN